MYVCIYIYIYIYIWFLHAHERLVARVPRFGDRVDCVPCCLHSTLCVCMYADEQVVSTHTHRAHMHIHMCMHIFIHMQIMIDHA